MSRHVLVVREGPAGAPAWTGRLAAFREASPRDLVPGAAAGALAGAACALVDGALRDPVAAARQVHAADPTLQVVVVADPAARVRLQHALLFAPGVGEVWLVEPGQVDAGLVERAAEVTHQRRRYRSARAGMERSLVATAPVRSRRTRLSDAFLASLLQAVPDPVLSVDADGLVLSWNPAAERVLGYAAAEAIGRPLVGLLAAGDPGPLERLLAGGHEGRRAAEVRFRRKWGEEGIGEIIVSPVETEGQTVRSVIVHDRTEQRRAQAGLETQTARLEEQAAELEMLNDQLQERTRELEAALGVRARFYTAMNHELRTPLNAVIGFNALLLDGIYGPLGERQAEGIRRSQRAAQHLLALVNDVLDLAKIEAGRVEVEAAPTPFPALLEEAAETVRSLAERYGSPVEVVGGPGRRTLLSDPRRVRQILLNLLSNAVKFGEGKPILVGWTATPDGGVEVRVTDRGRGIAPEHQRRIFDEFEQVEPREGGGTGLGLPISRRLAHLLGGTLGVESVPGEGSTFTLTLPAAVPTDAPRDGAGGPPRRP